MSERALQTILLIDDDADIHRLVAARLRSEGLTLLHADDAAEGLQRVRDDKPDLILLDLEMPGTDGLTACHQIKADHELIHIPIIFLTGTMDVSTKVQAFELGAVDYVTKPFDPVELKARVRAALRTKRYHDLLATKARIDALTGLWNRGYFDDQLANEIALFNRNGPPVALVLLDIDRFKPINDTHGHPFGDAVIQQVADAFNRMSRSSDVVCRYGGEEFGLILRDTAFGGALTLAERIRAAIEALDLTAQNQHVPVTASIGVAASDGFTDTQILSSERLLEAADQALYRAKENGRNRIESMAE